MRGLCQDTSNVVTLEDVKHMKGGKDEEIVSQSSTDDDASDNVVNPAKSYLKKDVKTAKKNHDKLDNISVASDMTEHSSKDMLIKQKARLSSKATAIDLQDDDTKILNYSSLNDTPMKVEDLMMIPNKVSEVLGPGYRQKVKTLFGLIRAMTKLLTIRPWDPANVDEETVQMLLHLNLCAQSHKTFDIDFYETILDYIDGENWIKNEEAGYGKAYIHHDKNLKAGVYRWDKGCIAGIHDHGKETVAFYGAVGAKSCLLNKVYAKTPTPDQPNAITKEYDEVLSPNHPIGILRAHHAHAIHNLSNDYSYTLHVYVPSYEFGLVWDYEDRLSVAFIKQSLKERIQNKKKKQVEDNLSVRFSVVHDG